MVLSAPTDGAKRLTYVLCLPLIDGVFPALLVTGSITTLMDAMVIGATVFAGAGSLSVLYAHTDDLNDRYRTIIPATGTLVVGSIVVALLAPGMTAMIDLDVLRITAAIGILVIAGELLGLDLYADYLVPLCILGGGIIAFDGFQTFSVTVTYLPETLVTVGVAAGLLVAASHLPHDTFHIPTIETGGATVLVLIGGSMLGLPIPTAVIMTVFVLSVLLAVQR